jgi:hypothetical protein
MGNGDYYLDTFESDRHRGEKQRHANDRALSEVRVERPSLPARLGAAILSLVRRDQSRRSLGRGSGTGSGRHSPSATMAQSISSPTRGR